jgi:glucose-6-phosphate isomerase
VEEVTPRAVGALVALYERAVGIYASLVNINAYHQPGTTQNALLYSGSLTYYSYPYDHLCSMRYTGVEAGKKAAGEVLALQKRVLTVMNEARHEISY